MLEFSYALQLVESQCSALADAVSRRIGQNEKERNTKRVYELIRECDDGLPKHALTRKTQWLTALERKGIIDTLVDAELIYRADQAEGRQRAAGRALPSPGVAAMPFFPSILQFLQNQPFEEISPRKT